MVAVGLLTACNGMGKKGTGEPIRISGEAQGTYYSIIYYDEQQRNLQDEIKAFLDEFDKTASLWVENSMLRHVNENKDSVVNETFAELLRLSTEMNSFTEGNFDCTVGKLVNAWGFGFEKREEVSDATIDSLLQYTGRQPQIVRDEQGRLIVRKPFAETSFDFNAIAQGYTTDKICQLLESKGITNYLVDIGGEIYAKGTKPDGKKWVVGIERPAENKYSSREIETSIELSGMSVVTSGSYRKYYEKDGERYSHTIDPKTGRPVEHTLLSVSVIDTASWRADALATAFMVMGLEKSLDFIKRHPDDTGTQAVFFIYTENGEYRTYATPGFARFMNND